MKLPNPDGSPVDELAIGIHGVRVELEREVAPDQRKNLRECLDILESIANGLRNHIKDPKDS